MVFPQRIVLTVSKFDSPKTVLNEVMRIHPELSKMVIPMLNNLEQSLLSANRIEKEARDRHLAMNSSNITFDTLIDFLPRYAPLQLFGERRHTKRLPVGKRVLSSCNHMYAVAALAMEARGTTLTSILSVDGRSALPHPLWTIRHDAILIKAIFTYGWVDREKACRKIVSDVKFGYPFDLTEQEDTKTK